MQRACRSPRMYASPCRLLRVFQATVLHCRRIVVDDARSMQPTPIQKGPRGTPMYSLLLSIIYIAFVSLGLPDSLVGAGWPVMHADLGVPVSYAGMLTMIIAACTILSSLASERLTRRFGAGMVTAFSVGLTAAALMGFSTSHSFLVLCLWAIPYGLGAGAVDAALNNYVALHYAARHMNWLHSFWGLGASISPFIMSFALSTDLGWPRAYRIIGLIQAVLTVCLLASLPLWKKVNPEPPRRSSISKESTSSDASKADSTHRPDEHVTLMQAVRIPGVIPVLLAFFAYCGLEATSMLWSSTYLVSSRGVDAATAAAFASLFLLGITVGRFLSGFFADRIGDRLLIRYGFATVAAGAVMIALPIQTTVLALAGLMIAGLGSAPIYPAIIHSTPLHFGEGNSQAIIGIEMASAYVGSTLAPPLFGALSAWLGMWLFPIYIALFVALGLAMSESLNRIKRRSAVRKD